MVATNPLDNIHFNIFLINLYIFQVVWNSIIYNMLDYHINMKQWLTIIILSFIWHNMNIILWYTKIAHSIIRYDLFILIPHYFQYFDRQLLNFSLRTRSHAL